MRIGPSSVCPILKLLISLSCRCSGNRARPSGTRTYLPDGEGTLGKTREKESPIYRKFGRAHSPVARLR